MHTYSSMELSRGDFYTWQGGPLFWIFDTLLGGYYCNIVPHFKALEKRHIILKIRNQKSKNYLEYFIKCVQKEKNLSKNHAKNFCRTEIDYLRASWRPLVMFLCSYFWKLIKLLYLIILNHYSPFNYVCTEAKLPKTITKTFCIIL